MLEKYQSQQKLQAEQQLLPKENADSTGQLRMRLSDIAQQMAQLHRRRAHIIKAFSIWHGKQIDMN